MICWLTEVFVDIFFDNEKLWIVLFLEDKWTLDTNTRHVARIYIVCGKYVCLCVQAKTVCRYLRSETIISTALYIIKKIPSISWLFSTNRRSFYRRLVSLGLNISSLNASRPKKENTYIMMINRDKRDMHHGRISRVRLNSHPWLHLQLSFFLFSC